MPENKYNIKSEDPSSTRETLLAGKEQVASGNLRSSDKSVNKTQKLLYDFINSKGLNTYQDYIGHDPSEFSAEAAAYLKANGITNKDIQKFQEYLKDYTGAKGFKTENGNIKNFVDGDFGDFSFDAFMKLKARGESENEYFLKNPNLTNKEQLEIITKKSNPYIFTKDANNNFLIVGDQNTLPKNELNAPPGQFPSGNVTRATMRGDDVVIQQQSVPYVPPNAIPKSGVISGPGTPKSDSITTKYPEGSLIVPVEKVNYAKDLYKKYINKNIPTSRPSGDGTVINVSDSEFVFTPEDINYLKNRGADITPLLPTPETIPPNTTPTGADGLVVPKDGSEPSWDDTEEVPSESTPSWDDTEPLKKKVSSEPLSPFIAAAPGQKAVAYQPEGLESETPSISSNKPFEFKFDEPAVVQTPKTVSTGTGGQSIQNKPKTITEEKFGEEFIKSLEVGSARLGASLARTPSLIYDLAALPQNIVAKYTGVPIATSSEEFAKIVGFPDNKVAEYYDNAVIETKKKINEKYDKSITDYFSNGEYEKGFKSIALQVAESAPISATLALGNAAGVSTAQSILGGGAVFAADKLNEIKQSGAPLDQVNAVSTAVSNGLLEGIFEQFGITKLGGLAKDILKKEGVDAAKELAEKGFKESYSQIAKRYLGIGAEESISEAATQFAQNVVDKYSGYKPDIDLMDGVKDAAIVGLASAGAFSSAPLTAEVYNISKNKAQAKELIQQKAVIENDIANPNIPDQTKEELANVSAGINEQLSDLHTEDKAKFQSLSDEDKAIVLDLNQKSEKLEDAISDPNLSETGKTLLQEEQAIIQDQLKAIESKPLKPQENAIKERIIEENNQPERIGTQTQRVSTETSDSNKPIEGGEIKEEKEIIPDDIYVQQFIDDGHLSSVGEVQEFRVDFGMKTEDVKKGIKDIQNSKDTAAARNLKEAILETKQSGMVPIISGTGGTTERVNIPISELTVKKEVEETPVEKTEEVLETAPFQTKKEYSEISAKPPKSIRSRIQPEPIKNIKPKAIKDILLDLSKGIGNKIKYSKPGRRRAIGSYNPTSAAIKVKYAGDLDTTAHEVAHSLDDKHGILSSIPEDKMFQIDSELGKFWGHGSTPHKELSKEKKLQYQRGEGVAEWMRAFMVNPKEAVAAAPEFYKSFKERVPEEIQKEITKFSDDIRAFSGATGHEQIMSNVEWTPEKSKGTLANMFTKGRTSGEKGFNLTWADKVAQKFTNQLRPFEKAFEYAMGEKGVSEVLPKDDIRITARNILGINEKFDDIFENGLVDNFNKRLKDEKTGQKKTLKWLLEPFDNTDEKSIKSEMQEMISYMVAERTVELKKKLGGNILTGIGGGIFKDVQVAEKRLNEFEELKTTDKEKYDRIKEAARRYREYADDILKYMVAKGRLAERVEDKDGNLIGGYDFIKKNNIQYVALQRVIESEPGEEISTFSRDAKGKYGVTKEPVKKIGGSSRTIQNPYSSLLDLAYKGIKEADRNDIMLAFRNMLTSNRGMYEGEVKDLASVGHVATSSDKNTIKIFVDGKPEYWQFQDDVYKALKGIEEASYRLPGLITFLPAALRWSVTNFPVFAIRNWIRDTQNRLVISKENSGLKEFKGKKEDIENYRLFGGGQAGYYIKDKYSYYKKLASAAEEIAKSKNSILLDPAKLVDKGWNNGYRKFIEGSETSNRLAEFRKAYKNAKDKGLDDYNANLYAAFQSRDLLDFSVAGEWMKVINQVVPFTNAAVQGLKRTLASAQENPKSFAIRATLYVVLPTIVERLINHAQGDDEEYMELPGYQRDLFYNFKVGDMWLTIPKPFELGVLSSGVSRFFDKYVFDNKEAYKGYGGSVAKSMFPVDESALSGPGRSFIEVMANYDFFRNKHIIPSNEEGKAMELRHTDKGSRLGQGIQKAFGMDARMADHFIKSSFSYFGGLGTKLSDIGKEGSQNEFNLSDLGLFKQSPVYNSISVQELMSLAKKYDLLRHPDYQELNYLIRDYFDAQTPADKKEVGKTIRKYSRDVIKDWNENLIPQILEENKQNK